MNSALEQWTGRTSLALRTFMVRFVYILFACGPLPFHFGLAELLSPFTIRYANATLGSPCVIDNTTYTDIGLNGHMLPTVVVRDNCRSPQYYCVQNTMLCEQSKTLGSPCQLDQECEQASMVWSASFCYNLSLTTAKLRNGILCGTTWNSSSCSPLAICHNGNVYHWRYVSLVRFSKILVRVSLIVFHSNDRNLFDADSYP